jgi:hypothetical protein
MLEQIKNSLIIATSNTHVRIAVQILILALILIAALQPETALAGPSWGTVGG